MADKPTVQDVLRKFYPGYLEKYTPGARQAKAANHILNCKTGVYGVNIITIWYSPVQANSTP
ncbi:MAG: hypothetical protein HFH58_17350 [Lachnospiraceae bacterium]|nr:hypothetical protein [Lachnospiraceae bacterium]